MLESGDWVVPVMEGRPYVRKPPLINWAIAASVRLVGQVNEWGARLPSALAVLVLALGAGTMLRPFVAGRQARPSEQARAALVIGLMVLANAGLMSKGRLAEIEAMYVALTGIAMACWICFWRREASPWLTYTVPWLWLGLGLLCKGPPHLFFFYGIVVFTLWKDRSLRELWHPAHGTGVLVMLAVFAPWALAVRQRLADDPSAPPPGQTWFQQVAERFELGQFSLPDWLLAPLDSVVMLLPWSLVLIACWRRLPALAARLGGRDGALVFGMKWGLVLTALPIFLMPTVRARFLQPLTLPCLALVALVLWHDLSSKRQELWTRCATAAMALLSVAGLVMPPFLPGLRDQGPSLWLAMLATVVAALAVWRLWFRFRRISQPLRLVLATALAAVLVSTVYAASVIPASRARDDMRPIGRTLSAAAGPHQLFILNAGRTPTPLHWRFYLTCPHRVIGKLSDLPEDARFVLVPTRVADDPSTAERLSARLGFRREVLRFTDTLGNAFTLLARSDAEDVRVRPR